MPAFEILRPVAPRSIPLVVRTPSVLAELAEVACALGGSVFVNRDGGLDGAPDHTAFESLVAEHLARFDRCLVVNLHSFPRAALPSEDASLPRPPVCIGFDKSHVDDELRDVWVELANAFGFEVGLNTPLAGSPLPSRFHAVEPRVRSLLLALRGDLSSDPTGAKAASFREVQQFVRALLTAAAPEEPGDHAID